MYQTQPTLETAQAQSQVQAQAPFYPQPQTQAPIAPQPAFGFQAKKSHDESIDALRAFARDMKAQEQQMQAAEAVESKPLPPQQPRPVTTTSDLAQTQDNGWFASMMSQNMDRYTPRPQDRS
jgi:hypothetical protein